MKLGRISIEQNDDGTYQIEICPKRNEETMESGYGKELRYSASSLEDAIAKIKEAETKLAESKKEDTTEDKKGKKAKPNKEMAVFLKE